MSGRWVVAVIVALLLAVGPWVLSQATPLVPGSLQMTPTAYAQTAAVEQAATRTSQLQGVATINFTGSANNDLTVYRCPDLGSRQVGRLSSGMNFDVKGWNDDSSGNHWFLLADTKFGPQAWVTSGSKGADLDVDPVGYKALFPDATMCTP